MKFWPWLVKEDKEINQHVFNGTDKESMSGRMGRKIMEGNAGCCRWRGLLCAILSLIDFRTWSDGSNHCIKSIKEDEG